MSKGRALGPDGEPILFQDQDRSRRDRTPAEVRAELAGHQDRSRWDRTLVGHGPAALGRAKSLRGPLGPVQAAIAACHARAPRFQDTDWQAVLSLYDALCQLAPSPVVELNRRERTLLLRRAAAAAAARRRRRRDAAARDGAQPRRRSVGGWGGIPRGIHSLNQPHRGGRGERDRARMAIAHRGERILRRPVGVTGVVVGITVVDLLTDVPATRAKEIDSVPAVRGEHGEDPWS
ncbi:hypothetical protein [Sphaerisporangium sp. TRM90804]|uniref:hypothetical protein n=1 Tax=Sphaerisporangium sp. TRM90804 TaxID=3031113 RepID=UPI0024481890|nr:hypothetical protein [Sphaerisporangium sp. TRM90804]MDH2425975.1 hypothetical protein [Sphaerisporangium sp. TRM90804]